MASDVPERTGPAIGRIETPEAPPELKEYIERIEASRRFNPDFLIHGGPEPQPLPDTWWSDLRWRIAIWLHVLGMRLAPQGTARDQWVEHNRIWANKCKAAFRVRYHEQAPN